MTFVRANSLGWGLFELLTSTQVNIIDSQIAMAVDGRGGDYALQEGLSFDGTDVDDAPALTILAGAANEPAMRVIGGGQDYVLELQSLDTSGADYMLYVSGSICNAPSPQTAAFLGGRDNTSGDGGAGVSINGGSTDGPGSSGGVGAYLTGGSAYATGFGGRALQAQGGSSSFTDAAGQGRFGRSAAFISSGYTYGDDEALHYGGAALELEGAVTSGAGKGGAGLIALGGNGSTNTVHGVDAGPGVVGKGSTGVLGMVTGDNSEFRPLPSEFNQSARAAVRAIAKNVGKGVLSEVSGTPSDSELNFFNWVGSQSSGKTVVRIEANPSNSNPGSNVGLAIGSNVNAGIFRAITAAGRQSAGMQLSTLGGLSNVNLHMPLYLVPTATAPNEFVAGEVGALASGALTGLTGGLFAAVQGSGAIDRVVTSGDRAAAYAWARCRTDGVGGITIVSEYGINTVTIPSSFQAKLTLDVLTGGPAAADSMAVTGSSNRLTGTGGATGTVIASPSSATEITVTMHDLSGTAINLSTEEVDFTIQVFATKLYGSAASRPTFYRP